MRRLRSDVAIIDRAVARLDASAARSDLGALARAIGDFLRQAADALSRRAPPPSLDEFDAAVATFETGAADALLPLAFALAALRRDCGDLHERMAERAVEAGAPVGT